MSEYLIRFPLRTTRALPSLLPARLGRLLGLRAPFFGSQSVPPSRSPHPSALLKNFFRRLQSDATHDLRQHFAVFASKTFRFFRDVARSFDKVALIYPERVLDDCNRFKPGPLRQFLDFRRYFYWQSIQYLVIVVQILSPIKTNGFSNLPGTGNVIYP
jgi:hypothetical protein